MIFIQTLLLPLVLPLLAAATPTLGSDAGDLTTERRQFSPTTCGAINLLCCNSYGYASDPSIAPILALLGINVGGLHKVGITCTPISPIGGTCTAQPLCCWWGAQYNYVVAIDCEPVNMYY